MHFGLKCDFTHDIIYLSLSKERLFSCLTRMRQKDDKQNHSFKRYAKKKNSLQCQQRIDFPHKMIKDSFDNSKYMPGSLSAKTKTIL